MANRFNKEQKKNPNIMDNYIKNNPRWWNYQAGLMSCDTALDMSFIADEKDQMLRDFNASATAYTNGRNYKK